jgi:hypothetical protein
LSSKFTDVLVKKLNQEFALKDIGDLHYFPRIEVNRKKGELLLMQEHYALDILSRVNMGTCKAVDTPMSSSEKLRVDVGTPLGPKDPIQYRSIVDAFQYLTLTRPDISFAVNRVCQFLHGPTTVHWEWVKGILRYVKGTVRYGLRLIKSSSLTLSGFSNADWARCPNDRRSTSGFTIFLDANLVSWSSRKHATVSWSSMEAQYKALSNAMTELTWLQTLLRELKIPHPPVARLWCDNVRATYLSTNPVFHVRMKHIDVDFHFVRERMTRNQLEIRPISSQDQLADGLTKPLGLMIQFRHNLNVSPR